MMMMMNLVLNTPSEPHPVTQSGSLTHLAVHGDKTFPGSLNARFLIPSNPTG